MDKRSTVFHTRPLLGAALGAVMGAILCTVAPDWTLLCFCVLLIPLSVFLFKRHSAIFLLPFVLFLVLVRVVLLPTQMPEIPFLTALRGSLNANADALFTDRAAAAKGILLGNRTAMEAEELERYRDAGLLHLFAVSGLHVTLLCGAFARLVRSDRKWLSLTSEAIFVLFLCAVTGFSASVLRAAFMLLGIRLTRMQYRQVDPPSVYCFAMACTLLFDPLGLSSIGFQLSFAAAGGMVLLSKPLRKPFKKRFPSSRIVQALTSALGATIGMLPIHAYYFGGLAWISIPLSIVLIPTMPVILIFGFSAVLLYGILPHVAALFAYPAYGALQLLYRITQGLDAPLLALPAPSIFAIVLWYFGLLFCSPLYLKNHDHPPWIGLGLLIASMLIWFLV